MQSLTTASGSRLFGSVVRALDFFRTDRVWIPWQAGNLFSYAWFLSYDFHVVKWGLVRDWTTSSKMASHHHKWWLPWKEGVLRPSSPTSIVCLGRLCIASRYICNLWQLRQWADSLGQWIEHWIFIQTGFESHDRRKIFSAMLHSFVMVFMS